MSVSVIREEDVERFVRHPEALDEALRRRIERALREDDALYDVAAFYERFYAAFDALQAERPDATPRTAAFVNALFPGEAVRHLYPVRQVSEHRSTVTVLAAVTERPANRFETLCTLAASDQSILVRIVHDEKNDQHRLYVLAKDPADRAHALVDFPDLGLQFVTDRRGRTVFDMPPTGERYPWADAQATFSVPVAVETLRLSALCTDERGADERDAGRAGPRTDDAAAATRALPSGHRLHLTCAGGILRVEVVYPEAGLLRLGQAVLSGPGGERLCVLDEDARARWAVPAPDGEAVPETVTLRLYQ